MKLTKGRIPQILRKIQSELRHACADNTHPPSPSDYLIPLFDNALLPEYVEASLYKPRHHDGM